MRVQYYGFVTSESVHTESAQLDHPGQELNTNYTRKFLIHSNAYTSYFQDAIKGSLPIFVTETGLTRSVSL
jgi:hypothetical protein